MTLGFSTQARDKAKGDALKQQLLACVESKKTNFMHFADNFYHQGKHDTADQLAFCQNVIDTVDQIMAAGNWQTSLFLRNTAKPLLAVREQALQIKAELLGSHAEVNQELDVVPEDTQLVYLSLFQTTGDNLQQWALQLASINTNLLGRPVYEREEDVQKMINRKQQRSSEAYVIVAIKKTDIQNDGYQAPRQDRHGNPVLSLKAGSIKADNIVGFVHQGKQYRFINNRLISKA